MAQTNKENKDNKNSNEEFNWNRVFKIVLGWSAILIGFFLIMIYTKGGESKSTEITFDQYQKLLTEKKIESATIKKSDNNYEFAGKLRNPEMLTVGGRQVNIDRFTLYLPYTNVDDSVIKAWNENIATYNIERDDEIGRASCRERV